MLNELKELLSGLSIMNVSSSPSSQAQAVPIQIDSWPTESVC